MPHRSVSARKRFNQIKRRFRDSENVPMDQLWLEGEQVGFFEQSPGLFPGAGSDYRDVEMEVDGKC